MTGSVGEFESAGDADVKFADELFAGLPPVAGPERLGVKIGDITMRATMPGEGFADALLNRYAPFSWDGPCEYEISAERAARLNLDEYRNIRVRGTDGGETHYAFRWDFVARLRPREKRARIIMAPVAAPACVDTILRMTASFAAVSAGGLLLHSAAVGAGDGAFVFCGVSHSGKSTVARLSAGRGEVLTDEMSLVERAAGGYRLGGTPFWGELGLSVNRSRPLKGVLLLAQAPENSVSRVSPGEAVSGIMRTVLCFTPDRETCERLLETVSSVVSSVPVRRLNFLPEASLWDAMDRHFG